MVVLSVCVDYVFARLVLLRMATLLVTQRMATLLVLQRMATLLVLQRMATLPSSGPAWLSWLSSFSLRSYSY